MAAPSYTEDLTDIDLAEAITNWSAYGGGQSGLDQNADVSMQGTYCVAKQISGADKGQYFDNGSGITLGSGDHVFVWVFCGTPGLTDSEQNKGVSVIIGTGSTAYCQYHVEGNDTYGAGGRVGKCYPIDYSVRSSNTGSRPYRTVSGSPGANPQIFGGGLKTTASVKGYNCGIDAIRYGTGAYLTAGELISAGDASDNPCTFGGFNAKNDANDATDGYNRWGILTDIGGTYELQGRFVVGQNNSKTATLCRFRDSDANIVFVDTWHAASDFTQIIVDHASTRCELTNINLTALGTANPGRFVVNSNDPTVVIDGGTWTDMGVTTLRSNSTVDGLTWRGCGQITLNQATLANCLIDLPNVTSAAAVVTDDLGDISGCTFNRDTGKTQYAVELTSIGAGSMTWDNTLTGYVAGVTGSPVTGGTSGNEAIYVNVASGTLTINVQTGATTPSIRTAGATVNVVAGSVTIQTKVTDTGGGNIENARVILRASDGTGPFPYQETVTITRSGSTATVSHTAHGMDTNDYVDIKGANQPEYNGVQQITKIGADSYSFTVSGTPATPATGTIDSTFVALYGLTNASGIVSTSRSYGSNQPVEGWARKSSASPYYKQAGASGTITTSSGFSATLQLVADGT